jgi:DNA-binding transcriptional regulator YiaG
MIGNDSLDCRYSIDCHGTVPNIPKRHSTARIAARKGKSALARGHRRDYISAMTGSELRAALAELGISQAAFARELGVSALTVNRWCSEDWHDGRPERPQRPQPVPRYVSRYIEVERGRLALVRAAAHLLQKSC